MFTFPLFLEELIADDLEELIEEARLLEFEPIELLRFKLSPEWEELRPDTKLLWRPLL